MSYGKAGIQISIFRRGHYPITKPSPIRYEKRAAIKRLRLSWRRLGELASTKRLYRPYYN